MRRLSSVIAVALFVAPAGHAQLPPPASREASVRIITIKWPEVEVRSGPSDKYPATGTVRKGAKIYVRGKPAEGFLEIVPPTGSVSWVPKAIVTKMGSASNGRQAFTITGDAKDGLVPIHPGGPSLADGPLPVEGYKVRRGQQGYIRGNPVKPTWDERQWYPIDPLPGESRFIPAAAEFEPSADVVAKAKTVGTPGQLTSMQAKDTNALFRKAQEAEKAGNVDEAIALYQQVSREASVSNDSLANFCATRVFELRQRRGSRPGVVASRGGEGAAGGPAEPPLPGASRPTPGVTVSKNVRATGAGFLRRTAFKIDERATYALLDRNGVVTWYVTPEPGINLEPYVDRWVDLHGIVEVRGEVRGGAEYMRVVKVFLLR